MNSFSFLFRNSFKMPAVLEPSLPISLQLSSLYSVSMGSGGGREGARGCKGRREGGREGGRGEGRGGEGACKGRREEGRVYWKEGGRGKRINQDHLQVGQVIGAGVGTLQSDVGASLMAAALGWGRASVCGGVVGFLLSVFP